jgi:hypothetical protein
MCVCEIFIEKIKILISISLVALFVVFKDEEMIKKFFFSFSIDKKFPSIFTLNINKCDCYRSFQVVLLHLIKINKN